MSELTPLLAAGDTPKDTYVVQVNRGYNSTSTSSEVEVLTIAKIAEGNDPVWEIVSQVPIGHFLAAEGYSVGGGAVSSSTTTRHNFYIGGFYPGYSEGAAPILDELGNENYLSGLDLILLNSYDGDSIHLVDITDPANPTIPVRTDGTHPSKYSSSTYLNQNSTSYFLHESTKLPNGDPNPYGPKIITREGATGGDWMGHIRYLESAVPFTFTTGVIDAANQPILYDMPSGLWVNGDHPIIHTSTYSSPYSVSAWYPSVSEIAGSSVHGTPGYDISSFGSSRAQETGIGVGTRSLSVLYYEDTGYTDSNGNPAHICMHVNSSNTIYAFFVPATGITDGTDWINTFNAVNGHTPDAWTGVCWVNHPKLTSSGLPGDTGSVGSTFDAMHIRLDPNIRVHEDSLGTAVVALYYANNFPATSQREHWVMTLDIRAPSLNLANTVSGFNSGESVIYDVIDCMNITDYLWGQTTVGGVYSGSQVTTNYMNRPFYDLNSRIIAVGGSVSSNTFFPIITAQTSRPSPSHSPMLAFFKIADDGTISHHNSPVGNGWGIEYRDNQTSSGYTVPSAQYLQYIRGNNAYSMRVYQRPRS